jgi:hypothetical protein
MQASLVANDALRTGLLTIYCPRREFLGPYPITMHYVCQRTVWFRVPAENSAATDRIGDGAGDLILDAMWAQGGRENSLLAHTFMSCSYPVTESFRTTPLITMAIASK